MAALVPFDLLLERRLRRLLGKTFFGMEVRDQVDIVKVATGWRNAQRKAETPDWGAEFRRQDDEGDDHEV